MKQHNVTHGFVTHVNIIWGKTRAAAASSILENFNTLQDVYEASLDSQGSAQQELEKYLDSIEGKVAQFQNRLQELAAVTIDSSWIKMIVDFGTGAIRVVTLLSKELGGLNLASSVAAGIFLQKKGGLGTLLTQMFSGKQTT